MIAISLIQARVARFYGLPVSIMQAASRKREHAHPRQVAMYLARKCAGRSLPVIGREFRRDHTTVIHAIGAVEARKLTSALTRSVVSMLEAEMTATHSKLQVIHNSTHCLSPQNSISG